MARCAKNAESRRHHRHPSRRMAGSSDTTIDRTDGSCWPSSTKGTRKLKTPAKVNDKKKRVRKLCTHVGSSQMDRQCTAPKQSAQRDGGRNFACVVFVLPWLTEGSFFSFSHVKLIENAPKFKRKKWPRKRKKRATITTASSATLGH